VSGMRSAQRRSCKGASPGHHRLTPGAERVRDSLRDACDRMLVPPAHARNIGTEGVSVVCIDTNTHGVSVDVPVIGSTRRMARLRFDAVEIVPEAVLGNSESAGDASKARPRGPVSLSPSEAVGGASGLARRNLVVCQAAAFQIR